MSAYLDEDDGGEEEEMVPQQVAELARAAAPSNLKGIRACKRCGILKTLDQFINEGCENCPFLEMVSTVELKMFNVCLIDLSLCVSLRHYFYVFYELVSLCRNGMCSVYIYM